MKLEEKQIQLGMDVLKLKQDVKIRWSSAMFMLERMIKVKEPGLHVNKENNHMCYPKLPHLHVN